MPRSYHGDAGLGENLDTAADIKNKRRVIDFFEARRIRRVVHGDQVYASSRGTRDFLLCQLRGLSRGEGLRGQGLNAGAFRFRE